MFFPIVILLHPQKIGTCLKSRCRFVLFCSMPEALAQMLLRTPKIRQFQGLAALA